MVSTTTRSTAVQPVSTALTVAPWERAAVYCTQRKILYQFLWRISNGIVLFILSLWIWPVGLFTSPLQGLVCGGALVPGAMPRALVLRPFRPFERVIESVVGLFTSPFQGLVCGGALVPGAMPRAMVLRPFRPSMKKGMCGKETKA